MRALIVGLTATNMAVTTQMRIKQMTIQEWLAKYYPTPAGEFAGQDRRDPDVISKAAGHARRKWEGAEPEVLQQLPGNEGTTCVVEVQGQGIYYLFGASGCALCQLFDEECWQCPLPRVESEFYGKVGRHDGCSSRTTYAYGKARWGKPGDLIQILKKIEEGDTEK